MFGMRPMLAKLGPLPEGDEWAYEIKWDGIRALVRVDRGRVRIVSRNGNEISHRYPEFAKLDIDHEALPALLDGEIVAFDQRGAPSFERLQQRMNLSSATAIAAAAREHPAHLALFDVLVVAGRPVVGLRYVDRRRVLRGLGVSGESVNVPAEHDDGAALMREALTHGLEGVIAKRLESRYHVGRRSADWTKVKRKPRQEFVVAGWTLGTGRRASTFGALVLAVHPAPGDPALDFVGTVGSGFDDLQLQRLRARLEQLERPDTPLSEPIAIKARFVRPELVAEVEYQEFTGAGRLRQPVFKGLRDDKPAAEVVLEPVHLRQEQA